MSGLSIFAGVLLFFSSSLVGLWIRKRLTHKASFYEGYYRYLVFVKEKISYERMPIFEINEAFRKSEKGEFCDFLFGKTTTASLSDRESDEIRKYIDAIGTTDADTQIASLGGKCAELKRFEEESCVKYRKDGALYFKLAMLLGLVAFIIIV